MQQIHPLRLQYQLFSDANPLMASVGSLAEQVRKDRRPVDGRNPLLAAQARMSTQIVEGSEKFRAASEVDVGKDILLGLRNPVLQSAMGVDPKSDRPLRRVAKDPLHRQLQDARIAELRSRIGEGGISEATVRGCFTRG